MNLPPQHTLMGRFSNFLFVYSPLFNKLRLYKDSIFEPISVVCSYLHITPWILSLIGLLFGLFSLFVLPYSYWDFVILMSISLVFDFIDGSLARYNHQVSNFGKYLDFCIDHILMILLVFSLCSYLHDYYWILGAGFFTIALYINVLTYSPVHIPTGRIALFLPCVLGLPQMGLLCVTLYGCSMMAFMLREFMVPNKSVDDKTECQHHVPLYSLSDQEKSSYPKNSSVLSSSFSKKSNMQIG